MRDLSFIGWVMVAFRKSARLIVYFTVLISVVIFAVLCVYLMWTSEIQREAAEGKALAEARVLNVEMTAVWDYVNAKQDLINYNSDGTYDFKGVYCTIAGKNVAQRFMSKTDYVIRYARESPRSATDVPDSFEAKAIEAWRSEGATEYYAVSAYDGKPALRYSSVLLTESNCLKCHGEPAGELDETGFIKEGFKLGDLAGIVSIVIPMEQYQIESEERVARDVALLAGLITFVALAIWIALRMWVTKPLQKLEAAARSIGKGGFPADLGVGGAKGEIKDLVEDFTVMAEELKGFYLSLEDKVAERTAALEDANAKLKDMNEKLQEANAFKSSFLTTVSHELRTPLASIIAFSDILGKAAGSDTDEGQIVREIKDNGSVLLGMINNIIDAARLEAGKFELSYSEVDLVDVVYAVERVVLPLAEKKDISLSTSIAPNVPIIESDREALHKILANLVGNAIKFTDSGGNVSVNVSFGCSDNCIELRVEDTGVGIAKEDSVAIFDRFVRPDTSLSREHGGSGLGLSLVKDLSEELGGSVSVTSELGEGSVFTVVLPVDATSTSEDGEGRRDENTPS